MQTSPMRRTAELLRKDKWLYLMALPGLLFFLVFHYGPMYGIVIAFKHYNIYQGIFASDWVGFDNFRTLFEMSGFRRALRNTIIINCYQLLFVFPAPIILALMINEVRSIRFKKIVQTSVYLPHFVSWIVIGGILYAILSPSTGVVKELAALFGYEGPVVNLMGSQEYFRGLLIVSSVWKETGFGTVLYLATIVTIDPHLYEAAKVDGARKWRQIWHITLPGLRTTIVILLIFNVGSFLNAGLEQVYALYNPIVYEVSEILDTYLYKLAFEEAKYDLATASGVFKSTVGLVLVLLTNYLAKKIDKDSGLI
ncbi:putative aldouronate transport system permease protein [Paenibacillus sp. UNCCL117]|uniref:ABC transporter permease n=1 Tax=unclassified Paenibacillus TaxID=185978 RepID=UPI00088324DE|nr:MULTISPECIES: ABC transporter permease subunit [unclassified Paenibacillus]SDD57356.1 putative aldouronate transport system permease protein [Paenibacillus sp. cl123]SFW51198.1 putative aldouronate transport system permease protein [Paenibacillus sp. UNCCL117]